MPGGNFVCCISKDCHGTGPHHCKCLMLLTKFFPRINLLVMWYKKHSCECQRQAHNTAQATVQSSPKSIIDKTEELANVRIYRVHTYVPAYIHKR